MFFRFMAFLCLFAPSWALAAGSLAGRLVDPSGKGIALADVLLPEGSLQTTTAADGRFEFPNLPIGRYTLQVSASHYKKPPQQTIRISQGEKAEVELVLKPMIQTEVTFTVTGQSRSTAEVSQVVDVLGKEELDTMRQMSLGDTLSTRPGISSTSFATAGRPIIRGLSGDRIRILENGLGTGDVSTVSVDHVITVDMAGLEQVEILRGAASLRYGGAALGGVVNMLDDRFPTPGRGGVTGSLELGGNSAAERREGRLRLEGGNGSWAWQVNTTAADTEDYSIPGTAERFPEPGEELHDVLADSAMELRKSGVGVSYQSDRGSLGIAYTDYRTEYGIPGHEQHHHHHKREESDYHDEGDHGDAHGAFLDLEQKRFDVKGNWLMGGGLLQDIQFHLGRTDYVHVEAEEESAGTRFSNDYLEGRLEAVTGAWGFFDQGSLGVHASYRDFAAVGEEVFIQPNTTESLGAFITQEVTGDHWNMNVGVRYDRRRNEGSVHEHDHDHEHEDDDHHEPDHEEEEDPFHQRTFNVFNSAIGVVVGPYATYSLAANLTHTERAPTAEALFASGPHIATASFEVGNPAMLKEVSRGLDVKLRKQKGRITGEISLFYMDFEDYIYEQFTGEEVDGLRETVFTQADSTTYGGESQIDVVLRTEPSSQLDLRLTYDQVRSSLDDGTPLPRITPKRFGTALVSRFGEFRFTGELQHVYEQELVAAFETTSEAYTLVHVSASRRFTWAGLDQQILLRARNITDEEARVHTSFLKDKMLLPGRNFSLSYRLQF